MWQKPMEESTVGTTHTCFSMLIPGNGLKGSRSQFGTTMEILPNVCGLTEAENQEGVPGSRCLGADITLVN